MEKPFKKLFVLIPDGVGLRNFAYTGFTNAMKEQGFETVFWNYTQLDLSGIGKNEIRMENARTHRLTDVLKNALVRVFLKINKARTGDTVYDSYVHPRSGNSFSGRVKNVLMAFFVLRYGSLKGFGKLRERIVSTERKTAFYRNCRQLLEKERPDLVLCSNQRISLAIAPLAAASDLGIPTATFIFSWDNLPKGMMIVQPDHYILWSDHMRFELSFYYPDIPQERMHVSGTPQFVPHYDKSLLLGKTEFFERYGLDKGKEYICYSGDDKTTSPLDERYLEDVAIAVRQLNAQGRNLGLLFRRCPVDFSDRYQAVVERYNDVIVEVAPEWKRFGEAWNTVLPTPEDQALQMNTIAHTSLVVNLGSSMVFDYAAFGKPCLFVRYEVGAPASHSVKLIYNLVHFRSMPSDDAVIWVDSPSEMAEKIQAALDNPATTVAAARQWFEKIVLQPAADANSRMARIINDITGQ